MACRPAFLISELHPDIGTQQLSHDDVIEWKHFPRYWPFDRWPVNSPHKGQWRRALMFSLICVWRNGWINNAEAGGLRYHRAHYDIIVIVDSQCTGPWFYKNILSYPYKKSHYGDKTVIRSFNLHNGVSYMGKMASLYQISPQDVVYCSTDILAMWDIRGLIQ